MATIRFEKAQRWYPGMDKPAVPGIDLEINDGEFMVLVGPSGCGKSTVISLASRLYHPTSGSITVDGTNLEDLDAHTLRTQLSVVAQEPVLFSGTIRENLLMGLPLHEEVSEERVAKACQDANIDSLISSLPEGYNTALGNKGVQLSGGQRQRVWVAMALAQETELLLLDEPTTYLDIAHQVELMELFAELNARGRTIVAVLHDLNHAARYASHIVAMRGGRIVAEGAPRDVITSERVEAVFGLANVVIEDPVTGGPLVVPLRGSSSAAASA